MGIVWSTAAAILGSIGGGGLIVGALVKWYSNIIADKLSKQYAHSLSEEMEKYKMNINKSLYVRQKHFDLELSMYRTLMNGLIEMTESAYLLFPCYNELPEELVQQNNI